MIAAIVGGLGRGEAENVVRTAVRDASVTAERKLFYPYYAVELRYAAPTLFGRSTFRIACLVDARAGLGATTDPFELETLEPSPRDIVAPCVDEPEAEHIAKRYTGYVLRNRRRALVAPTVDVVACALVYKPFWIVTHEASGPVLVDGLTGGFYPLSAVK